MADDLAALSPLMFMTHEVRRAEATVVKRFRSWARAESQREWLALNLLATHAPGLAPQPIRADLEADRPVVVMSVLPGEPLISGPTADAKLDAIALAINTLHSAIPAPVLADVAIPGNLRKIEIKSRQMAAGCNRHDLDPLTREAYCAALAWLDADWRGPAAAGIQRPVFAQGDGNLANYLWDGHTVRLVDFEDAGQGDRVQELADFVEHLSVWNRSGIDVEPFLDRFDLKPQERLRARQLRRMFAIFWLMMLLPNGPSHSRNPAGTLEAQAARLLCLLGA